MNGAMPDARELDELDKAAMQSSTGSARYGRPAVVDGTVEGGL